MQLWGWDFAAGCAKTSTLGRGLVKLMWQGHALNPSWCEDRQTSSWDFRASLCQITIHSLKPSPRCEPQIHPFQWESIVWIWITHSPLLHISWPALAHLCLGSVKPLCSLWGTNRRAGAFSPHGGSREPDCGQGPGLPLARFAGLSGWLSMPRTVCVFTRKAFLAQL